MTEEHFEEDKFFEDELEDITEDDIDNDPERGEKIAQAYIAFAENFSDYIKGIDKELWKRAVDYAKSCAEEDVEGIRFKNCGDEQDEKE